MRKETRAFVECLSKELVLPDPIVEIGSLQIEGQEKYADLRPFFSNKEFIGCDMRQGPGVDRLENLHALNFADNSVGTIILLDTMEHVRYPFKAMEEVYRVLKPGGVIIMTSVMLCPIHDYPADYWRFTPEAFQVLLEKYTTIKVWHDRPSLFPRTIYGLGVKQELSDFEKDKIDQTVQTMVIQKYFGEESMSIITVSGNLLTLKRSSFRGKVLFVLRMIERLRRWFKKRLN